MLWYFHYTRQMRWLTRTVPPRFPQKHHMRNAFYVPEYLYVCTPVHTPPVHTSLHLFLSLWSTTPKLFANFHMRWEIQSCCVQQCLIVKANVLFGAFKTRMLLSSKHLQHWRTLSTVKDHLYHSLAKKFWQWLTKTNLRLLAFTLGPLILSRIGVRIYKTYSVWQLLLQLLRKVELMSEQQRFTVHWPAECVTGCMWSGLVCPFQDSSNCTYHLRNLCSPFL